MHVRQRRIAERSSVGSVGFPIASPDLRPVIGWEELKKTNGEAPNFKMVNEHAAAKLNVARYITDGSDPAKVLKERHAEKVAVYKAEGQAVYRASLQSTE